MLDYKKCSRCKKIKKAEEFFKKNGRPDGLDGWCKSCCKIYMKKYINENKDKIKETTDKRNKRYYEKNKEKIKQNNSKYYHENIEECRNRNRQYSKTHRKDANRRTMKWSSNIRNRLSLRISSAVRKSLKNGSTKKGIKWEKLVGYSVNDLMKYFFEKFSFLIEKHGIQNLHIDHIIPLSLYNFLSYEDDNFKKCWNLRNLRLITAQENLSKNNKFDLNLVEEFEIFDLLPSDIYRKCGFK